MIVDFVGVPVVEEQYSGHGHNVANVYEYLHKRVRLQDKKMWTIQFIKQKTFFVR